MFDFERIVGIIADIIIVIIAMLLLVSYIEDCKKEKAEKPKTTVCDDKQRANNLEREYESINGEVEELGEKIENMSTTELGSREGRRLMVRYDNLAMISDLLCTALRYSQKEIMENELMHEKADNETV